MFFKRKNLKTSWRSVNYDDTCVSIVSAEVLKSQNQPTQP